MRYTIYGGNNRNNRKVRQKAILFQRKIAFEFTFFGIIVLYPILIISSNSYDYNAPPEPPSILTAVPVT